MNTDSKKTESHASLGVVMARTIEIGSSFKDGQEILKHRAKEGTLAGDKLIEEYERQKARGNEKYWIRYVP